MFEFWKGAKKETNGVSGNTALTRSGVTVGVVASKVNDEKKPTVKVKPKESSAGLSKSSPHNFLETASIGGESSTDPNRFPVVLIQEGMGNFHTAFYYTRAALNSAVPIFEGKKIFADHPDQIEEKTRPERSVKDVLGHYENVRITEDEGGRGILEADLVVLPGQPYDWARGLMQHAVLYSKKFPDQDFIGLSINANGDAEEVSAETFMKEGDVPDGAMPKIQEAIAQGITTLRVVNKIDSAVSCDLVTEAGAGGTFRKLLEQERKMAKKKIVESESKKENEDKKEGKGDKPAPKKDDNKDAGDDDQDADAKGADDQDDDDADAKDKKESKEEEDGEDSDADHDDEDQDKQLIMQMIKKYVGDENMEDAGMQQHAKEAYEAAKELGHKEDKAVEVAGHALQMHCHMAKKESEAKEAADKAAKESKAKEDESKHESNRNIALIAEISKLKESLKKFEVRDHLEKTLRESGLPMHATKRFRECVKEFKSVGEINEKLSVFKEAFAMGGEAGSSGFTLLEKRINGDKGGLDLSDCIRK